MARPSFIRRPDHVLFFAAVPPPEISARMAKAWQAFGTGEPFKQDTLHLSIYAVAGADELDPTLIKRTQRAANVLRTAPFTLSFDRLETFSGDPANTRLLFGQKRPAGSSMTSPPNCMQHVARPVLLHLDPQPIHHM